ncbi:hypothetical protein [Burkholderia ubonensis]|uniref:hypothetical protein n=1 Tax=Burkholderia ubonensis TaxID=101571 RepID=UPI000F57B064|nr:hypothetical protein [Burkholderia ubonensis]
MNKILISLFFSVVMPISAASSNDKRELSCDPTLKHHYDLRSECGFSLSSDRVFFRGKEGCSLLYRDKVNSPFFYGSIASSKDYLSGEGLMGSIRLSGGTPKSTRTDYYDDRRDVM